MNADKTLELRARVAAALCTMSLLTSCMVGPNYERPAVETPTTFKEIGSDWVIAKPADAAPKGAWWKSFDDPVLDGLMDQVNVSNQTLAAAEARYRQASATVAAVRAGLYPTVGGSAGASRQRRGEASATSSYDVSLDARWELDLWGRVRRSIESSRAGEQASAADLENVRLSMQAQLATAYFSLRVADAGRELLEDNVKAFETSFRIARNRYEAGVVGKVDVVTAEAQLRSVQAQEIDLRATRAQLEHAVATLIGKPASTFAIAPVKFQRKLPDIPPGLPSLLLERRPDVAAAERRMAQANERIGIAQAAYFPSLALTGSGGFASGSVSTLFNASSQAWALAAGLGMTLIDFGARGAAVDIARADYEEAVANYRQTVLVAFQEVEDGLSTLRWLSEEDKMQRDAVRLARESVQLMLNQYKAGTVGYLNVVLLQAAQLSEERQAVILVGRQMSATVALIRALGGSW